MPVETSLYRLFTQHPNTVGETYLQHLLHATGFSLHLAVAAGACLIHALLPFVFRDTGSQIINNLHQRMVIQRRKVPVTASVASQHPATPERT